MGLDGRGITYEEFPGVNAGTVSVVTFLCWAGFGDFDSHFEAGGVGVNVPIV